MAWLGVQCAEAARCPAAGAGVQSGGGASSGCCGSDGAGKSACCGAEMHELTGSRGVFPVRQLQRVQHLTPGCELRTGISADSCLRLVNMSRHVLRHAAIAQLLGWDDRQILPLEDCFRLRAWQVYMRMMTCCSMLFLQVEPTTVVPRPTTATEQAAARRATGPNGIAHVTPQRALRAHNLSAPPYA